MIRIYKDDLDRITIENHLIQNVEFLMGKNLSSLRDIIIEEVNNSIEEIITREYDETLPLETTIYLDEGKTSLDLVTTKANVYKNIISRSYTHGLYHTIISYLNNKYGQDHFRENRFCGILACVTNYNGMLKIVDMDGDCYTAGNMFLELFIDFLSFLTENNLQEKNSIDDYILGKDGIIDEAASDYNPLFSLIRLMLVAFNNDPEFNYQKILPHGIILSSCKLSNNKIVARNNFLDGVLINPINILDIWDLVMGEGDYIDFAYYADLFFNKYLENLEIDEEELSEIIDSITCFVNKSYKFMLDNGIISIDEYNKLMGYYNNVCKQVEKEFFGLKVKFSKVFSKISKKKNDKSRSLKE